MEKNKVMRIILFASLGVVGLVIFFILTNLFINFGLRQYINSYSKVEYDYQLEPYFEDDHYNFYSDGELKILELSDLHIGGGFISYKEDRKTIKETITILQNEKPDLVIINGDSIESNAFLTGTMNNDVKMKTLLYMLDHMKVYYTINFGGSEIKGPAYLNHEGLYNVLKNHKSKYFLFNPELDEYGYTNQCLILKRTDGLIAKLIFLFDSNERIFLDKELRKRNFDGVIFDEQVAWAKDYILKYTASNKEILDTLDAYDSRVTEGRYSPARSVVFTHLPVSEYAVCYEDLIHSEFNATIQSRYVSGFWNEKITNDDYKTQIHYSGDNLSVEIKTEDTLFEVLSRELKSLEGVFAAGDHFNNAVVEYNGVVLAYNYSMDNISYPKIKNYNKHRGSSIITLSNHRICDVVTKNIYIQEYLTENDKLNSGNKNDFYNKVVLPTDRKN